MSVSAEFLSLLMFDVLCIVFFKSGTVEINFLTAGTDYLHLANAL